MADWHNAPLHGCLFKRVIKIATLCSVANALHDI